MNIDNFKPISVRGRVAFGIHCVERALKQYGFTDEMIQDLVVNRLREFVEKGELGTWEQRVNDIAPSSILDTHPENYLDEYETVPEEQVLALKDIYERMPESLLKLIVDVIHVGKADLYFGLGEYSASSLGMVEEVIEDMNKLGVVLPDVSPYRISPFNEVNGWGGTRPISAFGDAFATSLQN